VAGTRHVDRTLTLNLSEWERKFRKRRRKKRRWFGWSDVAITRTLLCSSICHGFESYL